MVAARLALCPVFRANVIIDVDRFRVERKEVFQYDGTARNCLGPKSPTAPSLLTVPAGSWETHSHVIGLPPTFPFVVDRHYTPPAASVNDFINMIDCAGIDFGLLVQVSVHGTDNRLLVNALKSHPKRLRGIAVIDIKTSDLELEKLKLAGVVGVRILDIVGGGVGLTNLEATAARCAELGWHIQVGVKGENYPALVDRLLRLQVPFVMDHMGWCPASAGVQNPAFQAVLHLMRNADCMIKLSGGFRLSDSLSDWSDTITFAQALVEAAPDRVLWGSDWPHVGLYDENAVPTVGALLDLFAQTVPDPEMQQRVLADNPTRFYGRPGT